MGVVAASAFWNARQARAQGGVVLENVGATYVFGEQITFLAAVKASIPIRNASIVIFDDALGITHIKPLAVNADGSTQFVFFVTEMGGPTPRDEDAYFSYSMHQPGSLQAKALKDPVFP